MHTYISYLSCVVILQMTLPLFIEILLPSLFIISFANLTQSNTLAMQIQCNHPKRRRLAALQAIMPCGEQGLTLAGSSCRQISRLMYIIFQYYIAVSYINKLRCYYLLKKFRVKNFRGYHGPQKFFNDEIFPDYGSVQLQ